MKRLWLLAFLATGAMAQPPGVHTVYVLSMSGGLDQYLAQWLTHEHVLQVVTDPKAADAILTDHLGETFEQKMAELYPPPPKPKEKDTDNKNTTIEEGLTGPHTFHSSNSRGTVFLVDTKTRAVLWSDHEKPPASSSDRNLNREAERIVKKLAAKPAAGATAQ